MDFLEDLKLNNRGVTLIELIVAIGIFAFLSTAVVTLYLTSRKYNAIVWEQLKTQNEGRKVMQDFTNELRIASQSSVGAYPIAAASSTEIIFYTNLDSDTLMERVRYFFSSNILKKGVIKPTGNPLAYNSASEVITEVAHDTVASTSKFLFYNSSFTGSEAPLNRPIDVTAVRVVGIQLTLEEDPNASPVPFYIESKVMLRNLKDN
jgi:prepilin-type N-terminal cleavage/methylation domain-containing protein